MPNDLQVTISGQPVAVTVSGNNVPTAQLSVPAAPSATVSGVGGASVLADLNDVQIDAASPGDVLRYANSKWRNYPETDLLDAGNF